MKAVNRRPKALFALAVPLLDGIYGPRERAELAELADFYAPPQTAESLGRDPSILAQAEVIFSSWGAPKLDEALLEAAPNLKAFFYGAGSVRGFVTPEFWKRNILLTTAADANAIPVAEYCAATIVLSMKRFWRFSQQVRDKGGWDHGVDIQSVPGNFRSTAGFISLGVIARKTIEIMKAFEIDRLAYSTSLSEEGARSLGVERCSLDDIFRRSDVVSLHTPDLPSTKGMIAGRHFELMKPGATFINTARGAVVREDELCEVFGRRTDLTAILDVTHPEPPVRNSAITRLPNVIITPHIAGSVGPERARLGFYMLQEFRRYLAGEPLRFQVTEELAARMA
jgi:phosphoglycerate dehydrogenase-like enzyme